MILKCLQAAVRGPKLPGLMECLDGRDASHLRDVVIEPGVAPYDMGSVLVRSGRTQVICAATLEDAVWRVLAKNFSRLRLLTFSSTGRVV